MDKLIETDSKIFLAGASGMAGKAIYKNLLIKGMG